MATKIIIAAHKKYEIPKTDIYIPIHVGANGKESIGYTGDNTNDNISDKNYSYCELTGLYYAYKNLDFDILGLVHYRRYFKGNEKAIINGKKHKIIGESEIIKDLSKYDILLPKKRHYYIETNKSQYVHAHHEEGLIECEKALLKLYPEYIPEWKKMLKMRSGHRFNMFIAKRELVENYSNWLFDILFEIEKNLDISNWNSSEQRVFGYLSERLIDVYVLHNHLKVKNKKYFFAEKQHWFKKIFNFIKRKFKKRKINNI